MTDWFIDYNDGLFLQIPPALADGFCSTSFYKLKLKRFSKNISGCVLTFKSCLTYLDFKKIILTCEQEASKGNSILRVGQALKDFINAKEMHLESRSRLGAELKNQDEKLQQRFNEYRNVVDSMMSRKLREKQMWDSFFMCAMRKSGNFSVPGSGKTASVLGIYAYLKTQGIIKRIVVVCPKNAFGSWMDEFSVCFKDIEQLNCFNVHSSVYKNTAAKKRALRFDTGTCNLFLFNFESLNTYMSEVKSLVEDETLLVFDEVHKVKRIEGLYAMGAREVAQNGHYVVAMTGTPTPTSYVDEIDVADYSDEIRELITSSSKTTKFCTCIQQILELVKQGKPVVVWCIFIKSIEQFSTQLKKHNIAVKCIYGEVALEERQQVLSDFREKNIQVLVTNPHTLAESVSLHSVCHDAIYFEYSYNLVHLLQSKDRIHRLGLPDSQYTQYYFMQTVYEIDDGDWSMDDIIYQRLMEKEQIMLDAIDNHVLEALPTTDEDLDAIFTGLFKGEH